MTDNDKNWGPFTLGRWSKTFTLMLDSGDEEDGPLQCTLRLSGFGWALRIKLPQIIQPHRIRHEANWDEATVRRLGRNYYFETHPKEYGFCLSDMGNGYDFLQVHFGAQTNDSLTTVDWCKHLPWKQWDCVRHSVYLPDGSHYFTEPQRHMDPQAWDKWYANTKSIPKVHFGFEDYDGELITATCYLQEREWHRGTGWFRWLKYVWPAKISRSLDIAFSAEVGTEKGSWKGGTIGHGIDVLAGETPQQAFKRYCTMEHERKGRKYKLRYIGPCGPPPEKPKTETDNNGMTKQSVIS